MTKYINDLSEEPTVRRLNNEAMPLDNGQILAGMHSGLTTGKFLGKNSSAKITEADARAAVLIPALGACVFDARNTGTIDTQTFTRDENYFDVYDRDVVFQLTGMTLIPGQALFLTSGGDMSHTQPTQVGDYLQQVAWAISTSEYCVKIGTPEIIGLRN